VPDLCGWLCRAIGHLANNNDSNRDALGAAGACENLIMTLQKFPGSVAVCTEVCWAIRQGRLICFFGDGSEHDLFY
jgi:hypothetical protein